MSNEPLPGSQDRKKVLTSFVFGGILPVIAFTIIEEYYGTVWGIIAGMVFGVGEVLWELRTQKRVDPMTWGGNALILVLGGISLFAQEGLWFKLQPALMEFLMAVVLIGSYIVGKPILIAMARKQNPQMPPQVTAILGGLTFRTGLFMLTQAALATWAAIKWSTTAWALLKGVGFTVSMVVYFVIEGLWIRKRKQAGK